MTADTVKAIRPMLDFDTFNSPTRPDRRNETLTTLAAVQQMATTFNLPIYAIEITPASGAKEWDHSITWNNQTDGWTLPVQPTASIRLYDDLGGFWLWCETLNALRVTDDAPELRIRVERSRYHTQMTVRVRADGLTWQVSATLRRPAKPHPHLPGIPAPWVREGDRLTNYGHISRDDLRTVLTTLGVLNGQ